MISHSMIFVIINCKQILNKLIEIKQEENSKLSVLIFTMKTYFSSLNCIMFLTLSSHLPELNALKNKRRLNILYENYLLMTFQLFH